MRVCIISEPGLVESRTRYVDSTGLGITFIADLVSAQLELSGLKLLPPKGGKVSRQIGIATLRGKPLQPAAQAFVKILRSETVPSRRRSPRYQAD
jgi:DNA-binding transcriptional LysR family regulator